MSDEVVDYIWCWKVERTLCFKMKVVGRTSNGLIRVKLVECEFGKNCPYRGSVDCRLTREMGELEVAGALLKR